MKIVSIVGARPQFVKLAPLCRALRRTRDVHHVIIHSGQHYDYMMSKVFFDRLGIPKPNYNLAVGSGSHAYQTARSLEGIEKVLLKEHPDWVVVFGDTNTTLAGALAARKLHFRVAHIEAGLRSFNTRMPEETNRIVADHCSDLLLCPTENALRQLKREGISCPARNVGDIMYDVLKASLPIAAKRTSLFKKYSIRAKNYYLATLHREENTCDVTRMSSIVSALDDLSRVHPVLFPIHPRTLRILRMKHLLPIDSRIRIIPPVDYFDMLLLQRGALKILTDSGGVQKEAYLLRTPCVTLREETEWPETVSSGWNILAGWRAKNILRAAKQQKMPGTHRAYFGDGKTAPRIVRLLLKHR